MNSRTALFTVIALFIPSILDARPLSVLMGTPVRLVTAQPLSSKIQVKGELVALLTAEDVVIDGVRGGPGCLNRLAVWISGSPLVDHAAARSGWSKYTWSGVLVPRAECGRMLL